jgi:hypothetical protein
MSIKARLARLEKIMPVLCEPISFVIAHSEYACTRKDYEYCIEKHSLSGGGSNPWCQMYDLPCSSCDERKSHNV